MAKFSQEFLRQMATPAFGQGMFTAAKQAAQLPAQLRQQQQMQQQRQQLAQMDPNTPEGLAELARFYQSQGDMANAAKYAKASRDLTETLATKTALGVEQENLALRAEALGLPDVAKRARTVTDRKSLDSIANDLRTMERAKVGTQSIPVRRRLAAAAGISKSQFDALGLETASDADFNATIDGQKGKTEAWQDDKGNPGVYIVNDFGRIFDEKTKRWVSPSALGLTKAPEDVQRVVTDTDAVTEELAKLAVEDFGKMHEKAVGAKKTYDVIQRQLSRIEGGMPTGLGADIHVYLDRVGAFLGLPYRGKSAADAQAYMIDAGKLVAEQIKDFGSGTGLSDADRLYSERIQGADINIQKEALQEILELRTSEAIYVMDTYNTARNKLMSKKGREGASAVYPEMVYDAPSISSGAQSYLNLVVPQS
jgi:hypothetical protein